ncbi:hypothetical protein FNT36_07815 [Hymenobacter setariae]|uniref:Uncharacterized protein n=1 Tax=Hymenobacter setariae TaxID=2594794 RepID=A0A558BXW0_9BACT|nr:STM3941 family protein [Hymenobacter setariae]TVT41351.1 hypothetical protein FNT36_07815 [Hymenobacter setariae]
MAPPTTITIALSKRKLTYMLAGSLLLTGAGIWFILRPDDLRDNPFIKDPQWLQAFGALVVAFFSILGFFLLKKLRDPAPDLVVTAEGFQDNSSGLVNGPVDWADVTGIKELELMGQKMVMVMLRDPGTYIDQQPNSFKRRLMKTNLDSYGSPINISANALECSYPELLTLFTSRLQAYQASPPTGQRTR